MKKAFLTLIFSIVFVGLAFATHQRAAEITYKHIEGLTYEFTLQMWTKTSSPADDTRTYMPIYWGDGTSDEIKRIEWYPIPDVYDVSYNLYVGRHTFPAPGNYIISVEDPNRNGGVVNIPNSINVPMYIESELVINPFLGYNNSVQLLNPPIDKGCIGKPYFHNPAGYDPDGDSLSYKLVPCKGAGGYDIPGYKYPNFHDTTKIFKINPLSGEITWDYPIIQGEYNVAFVVTEWRHGIKIGTVRRDMQIEIVACDHDPPEIYTIDDTCVIAGDNLQFDVTAIDPDGTNVELTAFGGPFEQIQDSAYIIPDPASGNDTVTTTFKWPTSCFNVRLEPYSVVFKARDNGTPVNLVNFKTVFIKVIAPAPENLQAEAFGNGINLTWEESYCNNAVGYKIYRRSGESGWTPVHCETGVPAYTGFTLIKTIDGINTLEYRDDNAGNGLVHGIDYCYRITAVFNDEAESLASNESCAYLKRDVPIITNVSNDSTNLQSGNALVIWSKPIELDTIQYPGPYKYLVYRSDNLQWTNPAVVQEYNSLNDTIYPDQDVNLNSHNGPYSYRIDLESETIGYIGSSQKASSVFIQLLPTDQEIKLVWFPVVPWKNEHYIIFRQDPGETDYNQIGESDQPFYRDTGLENDMEYCYYIKTIGHYSLPGLIDPIINFSQIACGQPADNRPPCSPFLWVDTDCDLKENTLNMIIPDTTCAKYDSCDCDAEKYNIYYKALKDGEFTLIGSVAYDHDNAVSFLHNNISSVVGCYYVNAVDSVGNTSGNSNIVCIDSDVCPVYCLPNVFTPNGDEYNELFVPIDCDKGGPIENPSSTIDHVDMTIFNRWGKIMYKTNDPMINWDGRNRNNNQICPDGVYFYVCEVYRITLNGMETFSLKGSVTIYGSRKKTVN